MLLVAFLAGLVVGLAIGAVAVLLVGTGATAQ
jgi:uncharacterized membrane-anchored protein YhcB (DUF1043 family)